MPTPHRRRFRFSLRTVFVLVALVAGAMGWYVARVRPQLRAIAAIEAAGGNYRINRESSEPITFLERSGIANWLDRFVDEKYLHPVVSVYVPHADETTCKVIAQLPEVQSASLYLTGDPDRSIQYLTAWKNLEILGIFDSPITGHTLDQLAGCPKLRWVRLLDCDALDDEGLARLAKVKTITDLGLSGCHSITSFEVLAELPAIESLNLDGCDQLTNHALTFVQYIRSLETVSAEGTWTDDYVIAQWADMPELDHLYLAGCWNLNGSGFGLSSGFKRLERLDVRGCAINDESLAYLESLRQLKWLRIDSNDVSAAGLLQLKQQLPNCYVALPLNWKPAATAAEPAPAEPLDPPAVEP